MDDFIAVAALIGIFFFGRWTQRQDDAIEEVCCNMEHRLMEHSYRDLVWSLKIEKK